MPPYFCVPAVELEGGGAAVVVAAVALVAVGEVVTGVVVAGVVTPGVAAVVFEIIGGLGVGDAVFELQLIRMTEHIKRIIMGTKIFFIVSLLLLFRNFL